MDDEMRRWLRQTYLRQHAETRRKGLKAAGARRIDVTLSGEARPMGGPSDLDNYAVVRSYLVELNELGARPAFNLPPRRLSDTEVVKMALDLAAGHIAEERAKERRRA